MSDEGKTNKAQSNQIHIVVETPELQAPRFHVSLHLQCKLLEVLVVLDVCIDSLSDDLGPFFAVLLLPFLILV